MNLFKRTGQVTNTSYHDKGWVRVLCSLHFTLHISKNLKGWGGGRGWDPRAPPKDTQIYINLF